MTIRKLRGRVFNRRRVDGQIDIHYQTDFNPRIKTILTGVEDCDLNRLDPLDISLHDFRILGIIGQACNSCKFRPDGKEGGCKAYRK